MLNEIIIDGNIYKLESIWKKHKHDNSKDIKGNLYQFPKEGGIWSGQSQFIDRLYEVQDFLQNNNKMIQLESNKCSDCLLCKEKCIISIRYNIGQYIWDNGLTHYIHNHNIKPTDEFIEKIFNFDISKFHDLPLKLIGRVKTHDNTIYLKLEKNQIMIIDALMKHGGYNKKYYDSKKRNVTRYSEHAGFFDIRGKNVHNIIISGNTLRVDRGDEEIFLPSSTSDAYYYEYIFHTHPPTPRPGGRVSDGILYEFPSPGDIFHFIDHFNDGKTIGSLVMTPEGLYNIRKYDHEKTKIEINEDDFYSDIKSTVKQIQSQAISKYGTKFSTYTFYSKISRDLTFIKLFNNMLQKYHMAIDFYPRVKDFRGSWIVDTIYIPIYEKKK
jgi:hypothetical protein